VSFYFASLQIMPKVTVCEKCQISFWRPRAYRRHVCKARPAAALVEVQNEPAVVEDWMQEPLCSLELIDDPGFMTYETEPTVSSPSSLRTPEMARRVVESGIAPAPTHAETQTDSGLSPLSTVRRRILQNDGDTIPLIPVRRHPLDQHGGPPPDPARVSVRRARQLCDCRWCVKHQRDVLHESPIVPPHAASPGLRFVTIPGAELPKSRSTDRQQLMEELGRRPERWALACLCHYCELHRQFVSTWRAVRHLTSPRKTGGANVVTCRP